MKNDKRGFINIGYAVIVLIFCTFVVVFMYGNTLNTAKVVNSQKGSLQEYTQSLNAKERIYTLLQNNASFVGNVKYEDLNRNFVISTESEEFSPVSKSTSSNLVFSVKNKTDLSLTTAIGSSEASGCSYSVTLKYKGENIALGSASSSLTAGKTFKLDSSVFYDTATQKTRYGDYTLNITASKCTVLGTVSYNELKKRTLRVTGENFNSKYTIENITAPKITLKEGGV